MIKKTNIIAILVLIGALIIIGIILKRENPLAQTADERTMEQAAQDTTVGETLAPLSTGTDTASLETDLDNTDFSELDEELK